MTKQGKSVKNEKMKGWKTAYRFFVFDTFVNWVLGILFIFLPGEAESFISRQDILPGSFWILSGSGLLLFGWWQTYVVFSGKFTGKARMFSCILAWLPCFALTYALLFMGFPVRPLAAALLWAGNVYMFALGVLYLVSWNISKKGNDEKEA